MNYGIFSNKFINSLYHFINCTFDKKNNNEEITLRLGKFETDLTKEMGEFKFSFSKSLGQDFKN